MALDLYQLKVFWVFAKQRHFTKTAEKLFVTQSAVSHALKKLERSVGLSLIQRQGSQFVLTEAGLDLMGSCEKIFREIDRFEGELKRDNWRKRQKVSLGAPVEFGTTILVRQIGAFIEKNSDLHMDFYFSHNLHGHLIQGELDLIVDCRPCHHPVVERFPLFRERYVVIASPAFLSAHPIVHPKDLENLVTLSIDDTGEWWSNFIFAQAEENRTILKHVVRINHVRGLINGALAGLGVSFVPRYTVENELRDGLLCDVFPGGHLMDDHFCIYIKRDKMALDKNKQLIAFLTERFSGFGEGT